MELRRLPVTTLTAFVLLGGCSSDEAPAATGSASTTAASEQEDESTEPTPCAADDAADRTTVTIDVDDDSDGFGRFGLRTPSPLEAGPVRLVVNAVDDNPDPVTVTVTNAGTTVFEFVRVEPGVLCPADLDLVAGDYTVTFRDKVKSFTVVP
jgi:hypothetical protein